MLQHTVQSSGNVYAKEINPKKKQRNKKDGTMQTRKSKFQIVDNSNTHSFTRYIVSQPLSTRKGKA